MSRYTKKSNQRFDFFILFWTIVLAPFEYFILHLPVEAVVLIRTFAIGTNYIWYRYWFESKIWPKDLHFTGRMGRMISMKLLVNVSNFMLLGVFATLVEGFYKIPIHFTLIGFLQKAAFMTCFAIVLTAPYEWLLHFFGYEHKEIEVDYASDI